MKPKLIPTPTVSDHKSSANQTATRHNPNSKHHAGTTLTDYVRLTSTSSAASGDSPSQPSGRDTEPSPSAKSNPTASESSEKTSTPPSGFWPTPNTLDGMAPRDNEKLRKWNNERDGRKNRQVLSNLREAIHDPHYTKLLPTPNAMDSMNPRSEEALAQALTKGGCSNLKDVTAHPSLYPTSTILTDGISTELTSSQVDFLANLTVTQGSEEARQMTVRSGRKCSVLLKKHDPLGSLAKMFLDSSRWNSTVVYLTWRVSATPSGRCLFQLVPWEPSTDECASGSSPDESMWRTPNTMDSLAAKSQAALDHEATEARPGRSEPNNLRDQLAVREGQRQWATPSARDWKDTGTLKSPIRRDGKTRVDTLGRQVNPVIWPTPRSSDGNGAGTHGDGGMDLRTKVSMYPTPTEDDSSNVHPKDNRYRTLVTKVNEETGNTPTTALGSLNPQWVEWLMGYPIGFTDCAD